ncbi:MAG: cation:proton antiporter [Candidatus Aenigmatarchaeota archaeon]
MMDPMLFIVLAGLTVVVGYTGTVIFDKTKIPDIIWLIIFGVMMGPILSYFDASVFKDVSPLLAAVALMVILFDAGLNLDFFKFLKNTPRGLLFSVVNMAVSMVVVGGLASLLFGFDNMAIGLLLGAILGGTSSAVVITLVSKLNFNDSTKMTVILESVLTDTLTIIASIALINFITATSGNGSHLQNIMASFSVGGMLGLVMGIIWLFVLNKIKGRPFDHILTLGMVFLLYVFTEMSGGSGAISAFMFGLVLGNGKKFSEMLKFSKSFTVDRVMKTFQGEISFFIRSFFFVYLGITFVYNPTYFFYGIIITAAILFVRFAAVRVITHPMSSVTKAEANLMGIMGPRGLAAAVLATKMGEFEALQQYVPLFTNVIVVVIMASVIYSTIAVFLVDRQKGKEDKSQVAPSKVPNATGKT